MWRGGRPARPRARAKFRAGWRQPELTLAMETRKVPGHDRGEPVARPPQLLCLRVRTAGSLPAGAPNPGLPAKMQFPGCLRIASSLG